MEKRVIATLNKCYCVAPVQYQGALCILVAAEKKDRCLLFDREGNEKAVVWEGPGGVMTMVQAPGKDGTFLATQKFYSPNDSKEAKIIIAEEKDNTWTVRTLCSLPFVHRFDILKKDGRHYLIACALKSGHEYEEDWSSPGKIYGALLPEDLSGFDEEHPLSLQVVKDGLFKNHGYCRLTEDGEDSSLICCENGVFRFWPPETPKGEWRMKRLLDTPASDALYMDFDGDGKRELLVLSPFHGDTLTIYKEEEDGFSAVWKYPEKADFLHAIWGGMICGYPVAVIGHRKGARRLFAIGWDEEKNAYGFKTLDDDCGPANVYGYSTGGKDILIAANRETDEVAMYIFKENQEGKR
ncbi:MAG: hypothetical protein HFI67_00950 [Lachnospiraceae bacterium]|nr:hypothetical protein [Lachnospiraceae bacterium]